MAGGDEKGVVASGHDKSGWCLDHLGPHLGLHKWLKHHLLRFFLRD